MHICQKTDISLSRIMKIEKCRNSPYLAYAIGFMLVSLFRLTTRMKEKRRIDKVEGTRC
jgi:hypothetical protein